MNEHQMPSMIPIALQTYAATLFESQQQVRNLRESFPNVIDSEVYDLLMQCVPNEEMVATELADPAGQDALSATCSAGTEKSVARLNEMLSSWRSAPCGVRHIDWPGLGDVPLLFGSVWTVDAHPPMTEQDWSVTENLPMVVLGETFDSDAPPPTVVQVFPLSIWPEFAADMDLLVAGAPLPQPMMAELWNEQPLLRTQLFRCLGCLSPEDMQHLANMACAVRTGTWGSGETTDRAAPRGAQLGNSDDPRRLFEQIELLRTLPLRSPALAWLARSSEVILVDFAMELGLTEIGAMAAASLDPERPLRTLVLHSEFPSVRIAISECVSPKHLAVEVMADASGATCGATVLDETGESLGDIPETGVFQVERPYSSQVAIRLASGEFLDLRKEEG